MLFIKEYRPERGGIDACVATYLEGRCHHLLFRTRLSHFYHNVKHALYNVTVLRWKGLIETTPASGKIGAFRTFERNGV